jgi:alanyl-tRNA synthetase
MSLANKSPYSGAKLFQLKATHGMPLENALDILLNQHSMKVDWVGFVDEARKNEWWDFQTLDVVENALSESTVDRNTTAHIIDGIKRYMLQQPHPAMEQK